MPEFDSQAAGAKAFSRRMPFERKKNPKKQKSATARWNLAKRARREPAPMDVEDGATLRAWLGWLRPGGIFCASIREDFWSAGAIAGACRRLEEEGTWSLLEETSSRPYTPLVNDVAFAVRTWRVT